jgi:hypothetical protein
MLVRFRDLADPTSVERVEADNLAASFGPGVRLKRITVQTTRDAVTTGIQRKLGWLTKYRNTTLSGDRIELMKNRSVSAHLSAGSFATNIKGDK